MPQPPPGSSRKGQKAAMLEPTSSNALQAEWGPVANRFPAFLNASHGGKRTIDAVAVLDHPDAEQRGLRRPAVHAVVGLLLDLRPDAHPQPGAWRILHAGRLFRLFAPHSRVQLLAGGDRRRAGRRP